MGKKSTNQVKSQQHTKKIKKIRRRLEQPESEDPSEYSEELENNKNGKPKRQIQEEQEPNVRKKTRSAEQSVKMKIKDAFNEEEKKILRSMKKTGSDQDQLSDSDDQENDLEEQSSGSSPSEQVQSEEGSNSEESDKEWDSKKKKTKKSTQQIFPGFHRKIQINYEIIDKNNHQKNSSMQCQIDGHRTSINQKEIIKNLQQMRKSIQNLQMLFRNPSKTKKPQLVPQEVGNLINKYQNISIDGMQQEKSAKEAGVNEREGQNGKDGYEMEKGEKMREKKVEPVTENGEKQVGQTDKNKAEKVQKLQKGGHKRKSSKKKQEKQEKRIMVE